MKIIILTSSKDIAHGGGMDRVVHNATEALNVEFDKVLYLSGKNSYCFFVGIYKIFCENPFSFNFIIFNALSSVKSSANPYWKYYLIFSKIFRIKPAIFWHEMPFFVELHNKKSKEIFKLFKNKNTVQLCCSEANKASAYIFEDNPNVTIINNCILPRKRNKNLLFSKFTVITIGNINSTKGADIWTEVAIKVCTQNKKIQFIWCGNIDHKMLYKECLKKIENANLQNNISFLGKVEDAVMLTSAAHLYYCSSRMDSFPLAILEAMSQGKNIIFYDSGGVVEAVGNDGVYIPDFSIEKTVNAILQKYEEFRTSPETDFNQALYDKFYNNYTPEIFANKLSNALS